MQDIVPDVGAGPHVHIDRANRRFADAYAARHVATVYDDRPAVLAAAQAARDALADRWRTVEEIVILTVGGLRMANREAPDALSDQFAAVPVVADLMERMAAVELAVAYLEAGPKGGRS